jgi:hypothetical protein
MIDLAALRNAKPAGDIFVEHAVFATDGISVHKTTLLNCLSFFSIALAVTKQSEEAIRRNFKELKESGPRVQVLKHKLSDLWGLSLSLEKSFLALENLLNASTGKNELFAAFDSLFRISFDSLSVLEKINNEEIKSPEIAEGILFAHSKCKPNDIRELSNLAVHYLDQLA